MKLEDQILPLTAKDGSSYAELGYTLEDWNQLYRMGLEHENDRKFWLSITPAERLRHLEFLRRLEFGKRALEPMQRVLSFITVTDWEKEKRECDAIRNDSISPVNSPCA